MELTCTAQLLEIIAASDDPEQRRWYEALTLHLARQIVVLSDQFHHLEDTVHKVYPEALREALSLLPRGVRIDVLPDMHRVIGYLTEGDVGLSTLVDQHLSVIDSFSTPIPRHLEATGRISS